MADEKKDVVEEPKKAPREEGGREARRREGGCEARR